MSAMESVIGLEIHAQLNTATKLFCSCRALSGAEPNSHVCEVCAAQPGALPRLNAKAVELAAQAGLALGCQVNGCSIFSRKSYFYPDLPNSFQTSQIDPPICVGGGLEIGGRLIRLNRIHMEDDAGKCAHDEQRNQTLIDLNRAGMPLIEIVTEPDLSSAEEAVAFLKKLHGILVRLGVTMGRLAEGEFRCDINISLRPVGAAALGTRSEIKNLNSFRHAGQAIEYEIARQNSLYAAGEAVLQETRLFDPIHLETRSLRSKEEAHDYRYFPQPDLPVVIASAELQARLKAEMPEFPEKIEARLLNHGLSKEQAAVLLDRRQAVEYYDAVLKELEDPKRSAALMVELLLPACQREGLEPFEARVTPSGLASLGRLMAGNTLSRRAAYDLFPELFEKGGDPEELAKSKGVLQVSDSGAIAALASEIIASYPAEVQKYKEGQDKILSFFVGQVMKRSKGAANPKLTGETLAELLKK